MVFRGPTIGGESKECVLSAFSDLFEHGTPALKRAGECSGSNPEEEGESSVGLLEWAGRNLFDEE